MMEKNTELKVPIDKCKYFFSTNQVKTFVLNPVLIITKSR